MCLTRLIQVFVRGGGRDCLHFESNTYRYNAGNCRVVLRRYTIYNIIIQAEKHFIELVKCRSLVTLTICEKSLKKNVETIGVAWYKFMVKYNILTNCFQKISNRINQLYSY